MIVRPFPLFAKKPLGCTRSALSRRRYTPLAVIGPSVFVDVRQGHTWSIVLIVVSSTRPALFRKHFLDPVPHRVLVLVSRRQLFVLVRDFVVHFFYAVFSPWNKTSFVLDV